MFTSVIIPTFNRSNSLRELLDSLAKQTYPPEQFEVIVVDDGSTDDTSSVEALDFPFTMRYFRQANGGDAAARNLAVQESQADMLVFLDDDMLVEPDYLRHLLAEHQSASKLIMVGTEYLWLEDTNPLHCKAPITKLSKSCPATVEHPFPFVFSRNMAMQRHEYLALGMMQGLDFPGSSIWCDVDLAYRAFCEGFSFRRSTKAICYHRDYVARNLENAKKRNWEAAYRAVVLFHKYPELLPYIDMFQDKTPIVWGQDSLALIVRKLLRPLTSTQIILTGLEKVIYFLGYYQFTSSWLFPLRRWLLGGYIFRGYRKGLQDFGSVPTVPRIQSNSY